MPTQNQQGTQVPEQTSTSQSLSTSPASGDNYIQPGSNYEIVNIANGKRLDKAAPNEGSRATTKPSNGTKHQNFQFAPTGIVPDQYFIVCQVSSNRFLDGINGPGEGNVFSNGQKAYPGLPQEYHNMNQRWRLIPVDGREHNYQIVNAQNDRFLEVRGENVVASPLKTNDPNAQLWWINRR